MNTIELDNKKYVIQEVDSQDPKDEEYENEDSYNIYLEIVKVIGKLILKVSKFGLYLVVTFIEMFIKLLKTIFNLNDYKPFNFILKARDRALDDKVKKNINQERIKFATEKLTRHTYEFERSILYLNTYKYIQEKLKDFSDNNVAINEDIYKDILAKIDVLTVEVEKKALQEGYSYASYTKYRLSDDEVYSDFIEYKIMRGEGHGKADKEQRESTDWL